MHVREARQDASWAPKCMTRTRSHHRVVPVQPHNLAFTYCRLCHQVLVRDQLGHWVHRRDEAEDALARAVGKQRRGT